MKSNTVGVVAALALGGLVLCSNCTLAQEGGEGKKGGKRGFSVEQQMERMTEQLSLTAEQKPKVKAVLEETNKKRQEIPQEQRREKMQALMQEQDKKLKAILKPEQYEKWQKQREEMRQRGKQGEGKKKN